MTTYREILESWNKGTEMKDVYLQNIQKNIFKSELMLNEYNFLLDYMPELNSVSNTLVTVNYFKFITWHNEKKNKKQIEIVFYYLSKLLPVICDSLFFFQIYYLV